LAHDATGADDMIRVIRKIPRPCRSFARARENRVVIPVASASAAKATCDRFNRLVDPNIAHAKRVFRRR
jgi:hypothetical protein